MSSNIRIKKKCQLCNSEFIAKTTVTKFCGDTCAKIAYKARKRAEKIQKVSKPQKVKADPKEKVQDLQLKEFLSVKEAAVLLGCSVKTIYRLIENEQLKAVNLGQRLTRIKRTEVDYIFNQQN
ncbi:helix-turn-helix domain-containing protein [Antarcticibacterium flavum]|uniref:Helix-turn-helix domain-containing protein n=1 Tax=Antarcticibacterium flavum TaxID=2058175 RepID=A0A5B7X190_9FLAO|nr:MULTISPECIES: helix-turn-helix domain-containing protein [Antarcticibacterium]MCM4161718.1 DNA-binding protein [Antarcticibacterium sp. W02-3]QCY68363.1 helix-turn-helix domain-containing protein [Antarcticibacterium flavum]